MYLDICVYINLLMNVTLNRCGMQPKELLKLATSGYFYVLKISRESDGRYVLKRMCQYLYPAWKRVSSAASREDLQFDIELFSNRSMVLVASEKLSLSDFDNMKKAGFRVLRKADGKDFLVKEYMQESRSWRILERFKSVSQRDFWLASCLYDHTMVLVN